MPFLLAPRVFLEDPWPMITIPYRRPSKASSVLHSSHMILFVTFINISFSFTKERPWSSKDRIGLSEEGEKKKKFSSETHYWWAKWVRGQNQPFWVVVCTQPYTAADEENCILNNCIDTRGGNRLHSQLPSECDYLQSTWVYIDY